MNLTLNKWFTGQDIGGEKNEQKLEDRQSWQVMPLKNKYFLDLCFVGALQVGEAERLTLYQYLNGKKN